MLAASLVPPRPNGIGFATAGAIVTTVGLLLLYQWRNDHFESWAYAWALLPGAAGLAQILYGLFAGQRQMVTRGIRMTAVAGILFVAGAWFFAGVFAGEPISRGLDWWPIGLVAIGALVVAGAFLRPSDQATTSAEATSREAPIDPATPA